MINRSKHDEYEVLHVNSVKSLLIKRTAEGCWKEVATLDSCSDAKSLARKLNEHAARGEHVCPDLCDRCGSDMSA